MFPTEGKAEGAPRIGAIAAFGMAASPVFIAIPMLGAAAVGVQPPTGDLDSEIASILAQPILYGTAGLVFVILGASLIILALALHDRLRRVAPVAMPIGAAAGVIGGALIMLAGFGPATLAADVARIEGQDHQAAVAAYVTNGLVSTRLSWNGMVMFGAFALIVSIVGARVGLLPRLLSYLGILLGIMLIVGYLLPVWFASIPIIVVWSAWLGIVLFRAESRVARSAT